MQLSDVIGSVRRHWRLSVAMVLLSAAGLGAFLFTRKEVRGEDRWQASVLLLVPTRGRDGTLPEGVPPSLLQGQTQLALSTATTSAALTGAKLTETDRPNVTFGFASNFDPNADPKTGTGRGDILTLTVTAPDRDTAIRLADSFASAYEASRRDVVARSQDGGSRKTRLSLEIFKNRLASVDAQLEQADPQLLAQVRGSDATNGTDPVGAPINAPPDAPIDTVLLAYQHRALVDRIVAARQEYAADSIGQLAASSFSTAVEHPNPIQIVPELPSPLVPIAVGITIALLLGIGAPLLMDFLDHTIREPRAAMRALSAPVLATIPIETAADLTRLATPGSGLDAAYRALATTSIATDQLPRAIVVTAPVGDAQDSVAANFAAALSELGLKVALVATDARQQWFVDATASDLAPTLTDMLAEAQVPSVNGHLRERLAPSSLANLAVMAPSAVESDDLLDGLPRLLEGLASAGVDVTVVAAPALLEESSATIFAWSTRSVLWVIETGEVTDQEAREAASRLELAGGSPFGIAVVSAAE